MKKKVAIIGGGIAGMTAGIILQKAGYQTEIYEKNAVPGGQCTGWKREGFYIDNCIHWMTGTKEGSALYELWKEIGALGDGIEVHQKEMFFSSKWYGQTLTFWRDADRTRKEMLELSPQDEKEIHQLMDCIKRAESMQIPLEKPFDAMNVFDLVKMGKSMKDMAKIKKIYGTIDIRELALRFQHPLIQKSIMSYMFPSYQATALISSYGTVTSGNGGVPRGGSLAMAMRIAGKYKENGGVLYTGAAVEKIVLNGEKAEGILLQDGRNIHADYVVCACDTDFTFHKLLPDKYVPKYLKKQYEDRDLYPVSSGFQIAFAIDGVFDELTGTRVFECAPMQAGNRSVNSMGVYSYDYEPDFAPEGKMIIQSNFLQTDIDYTYWKELYEDKELYEQKKMEIAQQAMERVIAEYPQLQGKIHVIDVWTPVTYTRYCNSYQGAYMGFITTKNAKSMITPGIVKGIDNVLLASQWLMGPGGLPVAATMGKFAAWRIMKKRR